MKRRSHSACRANSVVDIAGTRIVIVQRGNVDTHSTDHMLVGDAVVEPTAIVLRCDDEPMAYDIDGTAINLSSLLSDVPEVATLIEQ